MSFSIQKDPSGRIIRKNLNSGVSPQVTTNSSLAATYSVFTADTTTLSLNGVTVTSSAEELNKLDDITPGIATIDKPLVLDSNKNISNINSISCANIIVNGNPLVGNTAQSNQTLNGIIPGTAANSKAIVLNSNRNISNLNNINVNKLAIQDGNLNINKDYEEYCNTFISTSINNSNNWVSSCWADTLNLFVAISNTGTGNRIMTSPDGITWTERVSPADNNWTSVCWSRYLTLLVAVSSSGTGNRVMTSPNGIDWTLRTSAADNNWSSVCWAPELTLFVAVANSGSGDRIMTSPNGINWTLRTTPRLTDITSIVSAAYSSYALLNDGTIRAWGFNSNRELGDGTDIDRSTPVQVLGITNAIAISNTRDRCIVLLKNGTCKIIGSDIIMPKITNAIAVSAHFNHTLALLSDGSISSWGNNTYGQLGNGSSSTTDSNTPVQVLGINNAIAIKTGIFYSLALLADGTIRAWGYNYYGQLGDNTTTQRNIPIQVLGITNAISIEVAYYHCFAILSDGTIRSWGRNNYGQLGDGTTTDRKTPVQVLGITNAIAICTSEYMSMALLADGTIRSWGNNYYGSLGNGISTTTYSTIPVQVLNINNAIGISCAYSHGLALLSDGTVKSWGYNNRGQLGDGTSISKSSPVSVVTSATDSTPLSNILLNYNINYNSITWSRNLNLLVAVGNGNRVITSSDGINWNYKFASSYSYTNWQSVCWAAEIGLFIAVGKDGTNCIMTSKNGINWISRSSNINNDWKQIAWSNEFGIAMAICDNYSSSKVLLSTDGINWLSTNVSSDKKLSTICWSYSLKKFCILSNNDDSYRYLTNWTVSSAPINITDQFRQVKWFPHINSFIAVGLSGKILTSPDGITWTARSSGNNLLAINAVEYSPTLNLFVVVADGRTISSHILTSPDAITWTTRTSASSRNWTSLAWGNGVFVATAENSGSTTTTVMTSSNGTSWTLRTVPSQGEWRQVIWVNELNLFVAVGSSTGARVMTSPDGISWTSQTAAEENNWKSVAWSPTLNLLVAVADISPTSNNMNLVMTSPDGINWTSYPTPLTYLWYVIWASELNLFVAINRDSRSNPTGSIMYSSNGKNWNVVLTKINQQFWSIAWSGSLNTFIGVSTTINNENIIRSIPSSNDTNIYSFLTNYSNSNKINLSKIIKNIYPSKSIVKYGIKEWYPKSYSTEINWNCIIWAGTRYVITGSDPSSQIKILNSADGLVWSDYNNVNSLNFAGNTLVYSSELNIVVCLGSYISGGLYYFFTSSNNGSSWIIRTTTNNNNWKSACWSSDLMMFVAVADSGNNNRVMVSYDGLTWLLQKTNNNNWNSVCWSSELQLFVAVASSGSNRVMTSPDGINWTIQNASSNLNWNSICWSSDLMLFVAVASSGTGNRIMTSSDGINWNSRSSPEDNNWNYVIWVPELKVFVAVASSGTNRLMYSFNGIDWKSRQLAINNSWQSICWSPTYGQFIMVSSDGTGNRIYRSRIMLINSNNTLSNGSSVFITNNLKINDNNLISFYSNITPTHQFEYTDISSAFRFGYLSSPGTTSYLQLGFNSLTTPEFELNSTNTNINISDHNGSTGGLSLAGTLITSSGSQLNSLSGVEPGIANSSSALVTDSSRNISNINNITCDSLTINSLSSFLTEGEAISNTILVTDSSKNIKNINSVGLNNLKINNTTLKAYNNNLINNITYATTFTSSSIITDINAAKTGCWVPELGIFVVGSTNASINSSSSFSISNDGYNWISYRVANFPNINGIAWSPKLRLFVAIPISWSPKSSTFYTSSNGINWQSITVPLTVEWNSIVWSNDLEMFAAISVGETNGTAIITSTDGINWTARTSQNGTWYKLIAANGYFIGCGIGNIIYSSNGINWSVTPLSANWSSITYSSTLNLYVTVAFSSTNRIATSSDLINWTIRTAPVTNDWRDVLWISELNLFIAVASSGTNDRIIISYDGINWFVRSTSNSNNNFYNIIWSSALGRMILLSNGTSVLVSNSNLSTKITEYKNNQYETSLNRIVNKNTKYMRNKIGIVNNWNSRETAIDTSTLISSLSSSSITLQYESALAILSNGTIKSWGNNYAGQLGNGTTNASYTPINVSGITTANKIITQEGASMVLLSNGAITAWGENPSGKLGDGTITQRLTPVSISGITTAVDISLGQSFGCAVLSNGTIRSWGYNINGQLGNGTNTNSLSHVTVANISNAIAVRSGTNHSIALLSNNTYMVWGVNGYSQLGDGTTVAKNIPFTPSNRNYTNVIRINANFDNTGVVLSDNTIRSWGSFSAGSSITSITNVIDLALGYEHGLLLLSNGTIKSWGKNTRGQLGDNTTNNSLTTAVDVIGISNAIGIAAGMYSSMALLSDGTIKMWGYNNFGQLGINSTITQNIPVSVYTSSTDTTPLSNVKLLTTSEISYLKSTWNSIIRASELNLFVAVSSSGTGNRVMTSSTGISWTKRTTPTTTSIASTVYVKYISAGFEHSLALMSDGTVKSWGYNEYGQLGDGTTTNSNTPITISGLNNVIGISAGMWSSYALLSDGTIKSWGYNQHGELGDGTDIDKLTPVSVTGISTAINISNGDSHAIALLSDGTVKAWGTNYEGELGDGTNNGSLSPVIVSNLSNVIAIDSKGSHNLALLSDGTVKAWGYNEYGQLGNNSTISSSTIVTVSNLSGVKKIACGPSQHSLALLNDGTVKAWGSNGKGQLGDETYNDKLTPVTVSGLSNVKDISGGHEFSLALLNNGTIKSWGDNSYGKLGVNSDDITLVKTNIPLTVNAITTANSISAGTYHALAILENGNIMSWGRNNNGQLGNNSTTDTISPINVHTSSISSDPLTNAKLIQYTITSNNSNNFTSICWSAELSLFVAVASSGTGDRVMTSTDGISWTSRTSASDNNWSSVIWCKEISLFVAVASSGTGDRVMTSSDGITWNSRTSASDNNWTSVCWAPELNLLVAVASSGSGNRVMTSPDGINWTSRTSASDNNWNSVCWCNNINSFIAVSNSNNSYRSVMTSNDGITWISQTCENNNNWKQVIWINELNMAVAISNNGSKRIMTSFNGMDWQLRNLSITNSWTSLVWASDLAMLCAISNTDTLNQIATSIMAYPTYKTALVANPGQLVINNSTRGIGLGVSPSYQLHLSTDSAYKLSTSFWTVSSDKRLKQNIEDANIDECFNNIKNLPLKRYKWKDEIYTPTQVYDRTKLGWIADDVQQIFPNSVKEIEANGLTDCKSMDIDQIIASLYGCIKKLMSISETKKEIITKLENKISNYKNLINNLEIVEE